MNISAAGDLTRAQKLAAFAVFFLVMFVATLMWSLTRAEPLSSLPSPQNTDGVFYDNIAFHLEAGAGFRVNLNAEPWRSSYVAANQQSGHEGAYDWLMPVKGTGPTALRSPAYPYVLAAVYRCFGRSHGVVRVFGCVFTAFGVGLLLTFCRVRFGWLPAVIAAATVMLDFAIMQAATNIATEPLGIAMFSVTFVSMAWAYEAPSWQRWATSGVAFGLLMLTRGIWSLGFLIVVGLLLAGVALPMLRRRVGFRNLSLVALMMAVAMVVASPWWIRNCVVTEHFQPFGTAGACGFVAAYCDESLANHGQWQPEVFNRNQVEVQADYDLDSVNLAHLETAIGRASMSKTKAWCIENWNRVPQLMCFRAISHWGFYNPSVPSIFQAANLWLIAVGLIGCCFFSGNLRMLFACVLLLDSVLVMLTWEHLGRYAIPIRPVVHLGYGLAIAGAIEFFRSKG